MYIGEYYTQLFEVTLLNREFVTGLLVQSFKQWTTYSYKQLKTSRLDMVVTYYHVEACTFQIASWNGLNTRFFLECIRKRY
jgi:hypothetical protein